VKKQYKTRLKIAIERIVKSMHLSDSKQAIQRIADLIPQFQEKEQIKILSEVGFESSLNAKNDDITQCVLDELRWICVLYELDGNHNFVKRSRRDKKRVKFLQNTLWEISLNIVEYRQSDKLLSCAFNLLEILENYSIIQRYEEVIASFMDLYKSIGIDSVGIEYAQSGYRLLNFRFGIDQSISRLSRLKDSISDSKFRCSKISKILLAIEKAIKEIEKKYLETR
jgi:hypothetical protein